MKAAGLLAAAALIIATAFRRQRPRAPFGAANRITAARAALASMTAALVGEPHTPQVAAAAVAMGLSATLLDGVDGWVARRTGSASAFGARFDMEVDACLILVLAMLVWRFDKAGAWILLAGLLRYLFVGAGWIWDWMGGPLAATRRGRITCVVQIGGLLIALAPFVDPLLSRPIAAASLALLAWSFGVDTRRLWRQSAG